MCRKNMEQKESRLSANKSLINRIANKYADRICLCIDDDHNDFIASYITLALIDYQLGMNKIKLQDIKTF